MNKGIYFSIFFIAFLTIENLNAQVNGVSIDYSGTPTREPKAIFQLNSTAQGAILPRMTAAQRVAIAPPASAKGLTVYQTDATEGYFYWDGAQWLRLMSTTGTGSITVTPSGIGLSVTGSPVSLGGTVTITSNATPSNTANTIVSRDGSGNFSAGLITANFDGEWRAKDDRIIEPNSITSRYAKFGFTSYNNNNTSPYADYLHLRSYGDATGGNDNLVMFAKNQIAMRVYQQAWNSATPYSTYKTVAFIEDLSNFSGLANPSATIGITPINGSATTALRSDAAPALSQAIVPTWTGIHTFNNGTYSALFTGGNVGIGTSAPTQTLDVDGNIRMRTGASLGFIPVSSADGTMTWTNPNAIGADITTASNGLYETSDDIRLGGVLTEATTITHGANTLTLNLNGTGDFNVQDNGTSAFFVRDDGNVGIGTTGPSQKLHVSDNIKGDDLLILDGNRFNLYSYNYNGTPTNGVKIKTNIPYTNGSQMPVVILEGYNYGNAQPIGLKIVWYVYNGNFTNYKASSSGDYTPTIKLSNESGKVVIFIEQTDYYMRFTARAYAQGMSETDAWFTGWTVADQALSGTNTVTIPYENKFGSIELTAGANINEFSTDGSMAGNSNLAVPTEAAIVTYVNSQVSGADEWTLSGTDLYPNSTSYDVGIGTTDPVSKLEIEGGSANWDETTPGKAVGSIHLDPGTSSSNIGNAITWGAHDSGNGDNGQAGIYVRSDGSYGTKMYFATTNSYATGSKTRMMINQSGDVGIGTASPTYKLHVMGRLKTTGINETSDIRLKTNISPISNALATVLKMEGVTYNWKNKEFPEMGLNDGTQHGLIAQQLEKIVPELVLTDEDGWKSIEYTHLVPMLIEAIKDLSTELDEQKNAYNTLKAQIDRIDNSLLEDQGSAQQK